MRYSIVPKDRKYVKEYGFLSFAKNMGKNSSNRYSQNLLDIANKLRTNAIKYSPKRTIQETAEATGDLIGNKIADKIASVSKKSSNLHTQNNEANNELETPKERYISTEKRQQIFDDLRLISQCNNIVMELPSF